MEFLFYKNSNLINSTLTFPGNKALKLMTFFGVKCNLFIKM